MLQSRDIVELMPPQKTLACSKADILSPCLKYKPLLHCTKSLNRDGVEIFGLYMKN